MTHGPVDFVVIRFPGNNFTGEIVTELKTLVDSGIVRILDLIFVAKHENGDIDIIELTDLDDSVAVAFDEFVGDISGLFSESDVLAIAEGMSPNNSAGLILYENVWASAFAQAVRNANGEVLLAERIPRIVIEELEAELPALA